MEIVKPKFSAESVCVPCDGNTTLVPVPRPMPCVVIFVHGVNSEGEWFGDAEVGIVNGLNERLGRSDLEENGFSNDDPRSLKSLNLKNSPVIRFYWGYRAPKDQTNAGAFPWRIPLKTRLEAKITPNSAPYAYPAYSYRPDSHRPSTPNVRGATYYWGGGPFQNGTSALSMSWYDGFNPHVFGINIGSPIINPERDRPLNACPKRTYYVNASKRLAKLIDTIYDKHPKDTIAVVSHSQGTMIASLAMFYVKKVPDTLFLCNSPYRLNETAMDDFQMGDKAPTTKARVKTFFNMLDRFQQSQADAEAKVTAEQLDGVGGWLDKASVMQSSRPGRMSTGEQHGGTESDAELVLEDQADAKLKWSPSIPTEEPVQGDAISSHHNHGRVFIYFSPHDRVMGSTPLQSIGWKGVGKSLPDPDRPQSFAKIDPFAKYKGVLYQRQFMRSSEVGGAPCAETSRYPSKGGGPWNPKPPKIMGVKDELTAIDPNETVNVNGPKVPYPVPAYDMNNFDENHELENHKTLATDDDYKYYKELYEDKPKYVPEATSPYDVSSQTRSRPQTPKEVNDEFEATIATPTNHSTILKYGRGMLVERILAYDLPIGRADSFADRPFWKHLLKMADWLEEDPEYEQGGDYENAGIAPEGVDCETNGDVHARSIYAKS
ncbi:T6SS effector phospholipase Tle3 domain-containing protein [Burkholderia vietnamiensis]|uniref:T6SS effector phospholipase Tle3 domain-containing protein n=1 Tax=Burkholderia vietnamiensis TaxID=60552 RepID=UPI001CB3A043|nr:Putative transmembrane protein [Burkholderia vietnamiensis]HDR8967204.1 DUF3274 domain-containing protein [Burkholderia vietnamiensis]